jgi:hypothetical protein
MKRTAAVFCLLSLSFAAPTSAWAAGYLCVNPYSALNHQPPFAKVDVEKNKLSIQYSGDGSHFFGNSVSTDFSVNDFMSDFSLRTSATDEVANFLSGTAVFIPEDKDIRVLKTVILKGVDSFHNLVSTTYQECSAHP